MAPLHLKLPLNCNIPLTLESIFFYYFTPTNYLSKTQSNSVAWQRTIFYTLVPCLYLTHSPTHYLLLSFLCIFSSLHFLSTLLFFHHVFFILSSLLYVIMNLHQIKFSFKILFAIDYTMIFFAANSYFSLSHDEKSLVACNSYFCY